MCGVFDGLSDGFLDHARGLGFWLIKWSPYPAHPDIVGIQFLDATEEFLVEREDVSHLCTWSDPVLRTEPEDGQPADVSFGSVSHNLCEVLFTGGVAVSAWQSTAACPSTIAVHDARDVNAGGEWVDHGHAVGNTTERACETRRMATGEISRPQGFAVAMSHVVVCGGSLDEWCETDAVSWSKRIDTVVDSVASMGARWITVCPYGGDVSSDRREALIARLVDSLFGTRRGDRVWHVSRRGVVVIVDTCADGRERLAHAVATIPEGVDVDEESLKLAVLAPALDDPDLVIIFGDPTTLPPSLVWELAYSELVFLNVPWSDFDAEHVEMAVDDFERRERRFGGVDS